MIGAWRRVAVVGLASVLGLAEAGLGQAPAPVADLERTSRRLAEALRDLGDDLASEAGRVASGASLERDARALQRAEGDWSAGLRAAADPDQARRSYAAIDAAWHRLRSQLAQAALVSPSIAEEVRRIELLDARIHQGVGPAAPPANADGTVTPPEPTPGAFLVPPPAPVVGADETRRLASALAARGKALASVVRAELADEEEAGPVIQDCAQLARNVAAFSEALNDPRVARPPDFAGVQFATIVRQVEGIDQGLDETSYPARVRASWEAFVAVHDRLRDMLNLNIVEGDDAPAAEGPPLAPIADWANRLDVQAEDLLAYFAPTARNVPEGGTMLGDVQRLRLAVASFRREAGQGLKPARLAQVFREVDTQWLRLSRRAERIAVTRARPDGQTLDRVRQIGQTSEQIHQILGMPAYPPTLEP